MYDCMVPLVHHIVRHTTATAVFRELCVAKWILSCCIDNLAFQVCSKRIVSVNPRDVILISLLRDMSYQPVRYSNKKMPSEFLQWKITEVNKIGFITKNSASKSLYLSSIF